MEVSFVVFILRLIHFGDRAQSPSLFLLLEEKLQRRVPLIPWKAVRQLAVIQRWGNCARGGGGGRENTSLFSSNRSIKERNGLRAGPRARRSRRLWGQRTWLLGFVRVRLVCGAVLQENEGRNVSAHRRMTPVVDLIPLRIQWHPVLMS